MRGRKTFLQELEQLGSYFHKTSHLETRAGDMYRSIFPHEALGAMHRVKAAESIHINS